MLEYLSSPIDLSDPDQVGCFDELSLWSSMFGRMMLAFIPLQPAIQVLDVGCGTGFPTLELAQILGKTCSVYGLDPWRMALDRASLKARVYQVANAYLIQGDGSRLPFEDQRFDLAVSNLGLNNFAAPAAVLSEIFRTLKPAGRLALTTNPRGHMQEFYQAYQETLVELDKSHLLKALKRQRDHRFSIRRLSELLRQTGFSEARVHREKFKMRFLSGSAFLRHYFIKLGFLDGWRSILAPEEEHDVFEHLEGKLNRLAVDQGELSLTIPVAYIEALK